MGSSTLLVSVRTQRCRPPGHGAAPSGGVSAGDRRDRDGAPPHAFEDCDAAGLPGRALKARAGCGVPPRRPRRV